MTNQLSVVVRVVAGVAVRVVAGVFIGLVAGVVIGVVVEVVTRVGVAASGCGSLTSSTTSGCSDNSPAVTATSVSISTPCSGALAALASPLPPVGRFGGILIH